MLDVVYSLPLRQKFDRDSYSLVDATVLSFIFQRRALKILSWWWSLSNVQGPLSLLLKDNEVIIKLLRWYVYQLVYCLSGKVFFRYCRDNTWSNSDHASNLYHVIWKLNYFNFKKNAYSIVNQVTKFWRP